MQRRREPTTFEEIALDYHVLPVMVVTTIVLGVLWCLGWGIYSLAADNNNNFARDRIGMEKLVYSYGDDANDSSPNLVQLRKQAAQAIVDLEKRSQGVANTSYLTLTGYQKSKMQEVASTGKPLVLDTSKMSYSAYPDAALSLDGLEIILLWVAIGTSGVVAFLAENEDRYRSYRYADLPWNKAWPWLLNFAMGPTAWAISGISALLLRSDPIVDDTVEVAPATRFPEVQQVREENVQEASLATYNSAPNTARAYYVNLRVEAAAHYRKQRIRDIDYEIRQTKEEAQAMSARLRSTQQVLNDQQAEKRQLQAAQTDNATAVNPSVPNEEFNRILELPGVLATQVVNNRLRIIVRATYRQRDTLYHLGDWRINIGADTVSFTAKRVRSGTRSDWHGDYPDYEYNHGVFCFGDRQYVLDEHLQKGQYLEAVALAIDCLNSVNDGDEHRVPLAFRTIREEVSA